MEPTHDVDSFPLDRQRRLLGRGRGTGEGKSMTVRCLVRVPSAGASGLDFVLVDVPVETTGSTNTDDVIERLRELTGAFYAHEVVG